MVLQLIQKEFGHFQKLPKKAQDLLISFAFQGASYPLIGTFINAYIWSKEKNVVSVALYNLGFFIGLPLFFYINGHLLKKIKVSYLYFVGTILIGLGAILVVFLTRFGFPIMLFGLVYGAGAGIYWGNRNYLILKETESENRNYFTGLNFSIDWLSSIIVPFIAGWFIFYTRSYKISVLSAFILLVLSGYFVVKNSFENPSIKKIVLFRTSFNWQMIRIVTVSIGIGEGLLFFLPTLLILQKIGNVGILGTVNSLIALISAILIYLYGRKAKRNHQKKYFFLSVILSFLASVVLLAIYNGYSVFLFSSVTGFASALIWLAAGPFIMDVMDHEAEINNVERYSLVFDQELFLNLGRTLIILILFFLIKIYPLDFVFRIVSVIGYSLVGIISIIFLPRIKRKV